MQSDIQKNFLKNFTNYRHSMLRMYDTAIHLNHLTTSFQRGVSMILKKFSAAEVSLLHINGINNHIIAAQQPEVAPFDPELVILKDKVANFGQLLGQAHTELSRQNRYLWLPRTKKRGLKALQHAYNRQIRHNFRIQKRHTKLIHQKQQLQEELFDLLKQSETLDAESVQNIGITVNEYPLETVGHLGTDCLPNNFGILNVADVEKTASQIAEHSNNTADDSDEDAYIDVVGLEEDEEPVNICEGAPVFNSSNGSDANFENGRVLFEEQI